jgi:hypothetical protein
MTSHYKATDSYCGDYQVKVDSIERGAAIITYQVTLGVFVVTVRMLNIADWLHSRPKGFIIAQGTFGDILLVRATDGESVCKRIYFPKPVQINGPRLAIHVNFADLKDVLVEFAIAKLCSLFKIGPQIQNPFGFDLLCFRDHVEFYMEKCLPFNYSSVNQA